MKEKAVIDEICEVDENTSKPLLLQFQNGQLAAFNKETTEFCRMLRTKDKAPAALVVASENVYHGLIGTSTADAMVDTYLCVRNKKTNKVRIIPIEQALLNNDIYSKMEQQTNQELFTKEIANTKLIKEFGGRKGRRSVINNERMQMNVDVVKKELQATVDDAVITDNTILETDTSNHLDLIRPKFNADAKSEYEVYQLEDVIPTQLTKRLEEEARQVLITKIEHLPIKSEYLLGVVKELQNLTTSEECLTKVKIIIYMDCLLNLIKSKKRSMRNLELSGISEKLENDVRVRFSDPNTKLPGQRTTFSTEKALCHFIVLALLISKNYEVDTQVLTTELTSSRAKVLKYAQIVNARIKKGTDKLSLRLPSTVPALSLSNRKKQ